jgi:hypothetical protein
MLSRPRGDLLKEYRDVAIRGRPFERQSKSEATVRGHEKEVPIVRICPRDQGEPRRSRYSPPEYRHVRPAHDAYPIALVRKELTTRTTSYRSSARWTLAMVVILL